MPAAVAALIENVFKVRRDEGKRAGLAFLYLFLAIGSFIVGRVTRTVLFLEIPDFKQLLPLAYIGTAVTVSISMMAYARIERVLRRDHTNIITLVALTLVTLAFRWALHDGGQVVSWAFYFWVEIYGTFLVVQFWSFAGELFHARQAKRLFAVIGGGGVLANVAVGFAISGSVKALGTENLLFVIAGCFVVALLLVALLGRDAKKELETARMRAPSSTATKKASARSTFGTRHVQLIALVVVLTYLVSTVVDYQFQAILGDSIPLKDERSAYLGKFFAYTGIIAGTIQLFLTSRILERFGLLVALLLLPSFMLLGSAGLLMVPLVPGLWAIAFTKGSENCLRYTVNDSTLQLLYLPVPAQLRGRAKALIDGVIKPVSIGIAGVLMALAVGSLEFIGVSMGFTLGPYDMSAGVAVGLVAWVVALVGLRREYVRSLLSTLQRRRLNFAETSFTVNDEQTVRTLEKALGSAQLGEVLHALELLRFVGAKSRASLDPQVLKLLQHEAESVRVAALAYLRSGDAKMHVEAIAALLGDASASVRAAAVLTVTKMERERALLRGTTSLADQDLAVRAAAVAGFIRYGGLDGVLASAELLKQMLASKEWRERERAAWILGEVGVETFYSPLVPLFEDANERVRLAAIEAAGRLKTPELLAPLTRQLERPRLRGPAVQAIAAYGAHGFEVATKLLTDSSEPSVVRAQAPKILIKLGDKKSAELLCWHLLTPDVRVRGAVVQALAHIVHKNPGLRLDVRTVEAARRAEAQGYFELLAIEADLGLEGKSPLLEDALAQRRRDTVGRLLALLSLTYPPETIDVVVRNLKHPNAASRANAVEVLDNLLGKDEKAFLLPLIEDTPTDRKLVLAEQIFRVQRDTREARLRALLVMEDAWLRSCTALAVADLGLKGIETAVRDLLLSDDPVCRETAIVALRRLDSASELKEQLKDLVEDPAVTVRRYARHVLEAMG